MKKLSKIDHLKRLTNYLISDKLNENEVLNKHNIPYFKQRIISYLLRYPNIINYINNNLNHQFYFEKYENIEWLKTFKYIFKHNNIKNFNQLYFLKNKLVKRHAVNQDIEHYLSTTEKLFGRNDVNELFRLYEARIIDEGYIDHLKELNSGKAVGKTKKIDLDFSPNVKKKDNETTSKLEKKIINYISNRIFCKNCPLFEQPKYPVFSNTDSYKVDCLIIGEFPTSEDFLADDQFLNLIKLLLEQYNISYAATNIVLCKPKHDDIPNKTKTISNCSGVTEHVYSAFNSEFKILIGSTVKSTFKIKGPITKLNGEVINNNFIISHPSSNINQFKSGLIKLKEFLENYSKKKITKLNMEKGLVQSETFKTFSSNLKEYTLFDIKIIENKILYILINKSGDKKYITEDISYPVYIKQGKYSDCAFMIDSDPDLVVYLTQQQKLYLNNILNKKMQNKIKLC
jgi:hypothetical protein